VEDIVNVQGLMITRSLMDQSRWR